MTLATMYEVATQEISSTVAPRLPIMVGSATFTMLVSRISSTTASITPTIITRWPAATPAGPAGVVSADADTRVDRQPDREPGAAVGEQGKRARPLDRIERDSHGHALHDLGEVPGRVVR